MTCDPLVIYKTNIVEIFFFVIRRSLAYRGGRGDARLELEFALGRPLP